MKKITLEVVFSNDNYTSFVIKEQVGIERGCGHIYSYNGHALYSITNPGYSARHCHLYLQGTMEEFDDMPMTIFTDDFNAIRKMVNEFNVLNAEPLIKRYQIVDCAGIRKVRITGKGHFNNYVEINNITANSNFLGFEYNIGDRIYVSTVCPLLIGAYSEGPCELTKSHKNAESVWPDYILMKG